MPHVRRARRVKLYCEAAPAKHRASVSSARGDRMAFRTKHGAQIAAAAAAFTIAVPAPAQLYISQPDLRASPIEPSDPLVGLPLPGATSAEYRANLLWNLRAGLNVAALQCQFSDYLRAVPNYNGLLAHHSRRARRRLHGAQQLLQARAGREGPEGVRRLFDDHLQQLVDAAGADDLLPDRDQHRQVGAGDARRASSIRSPRRGCASCATPWSRPTIRGRPTSPI